ncbi:hypothetical protein [Methylobacterium haplocladii]|uniref:Uncharacterized protein n=1 Tax=Methylobacterium haplocladii TaxID=1176176 RepID=A0A512IS95_9HYPH|nr:hypothetical protein [Methylobacterium haplocladii]GEP00546.1 hypothetical protein MHA02_29330 [Methylobacterium haplocladii]GJD85459.1 hypothetical protein HPGCJGGD_3348 [Methylobacterium haplocladii]GLS57846.1 hypothetical protein GCM10007887_05020 [Methylobacterium haplocladii]
MLGLLLILALNLVVSFFNARACGQMWAEREQSGPFLFLVIWSAAIQSAIGFSSILIFAGAYAAHGMGILPDKAMKATLSLWYLAIIFPTLGTGFLITIHSWIVAYRERNLLDMASAAYNTVAMAHNLYQASSGIGDAFGSVFTFFSSVTDDDEDGAGILVVITVLAIVVFALGGGALLTRAIIRHYAGSLPMPERAAQLSRA